MVTHNLYSEYMTPAHVFCYSPTLVLKDHHVNTKNGYLVLRYYAPHKWNKLQKLLNPDKLIHYFASHKWQKHLFIYICT